MRGLLREIIEAPARAEAGRALGVFREEYGCKYPEAFAELDRDDEMTDERVAA